MKQSQLLAVVMGFSALVVGRAGHAQTAMVDDPFTPERRAINMELTYISGQNSSGETQFFPNLVMRYGFTDNFEVNAALTGLSMRAPGVKRTDGLGDTWIGFKWRFMEENDRRPQIAFAYSAKVPTASMRRGLGSGAVDHSAWLTAGKTFGQHYIAANAGFNRVAAGWGKDNWFYGAYYSYQLNDAISIGGELYGNTVPAPGFPEELAWGLGFTWNFQPDRSFVFQIGKSERRNSDLNLYTGFLFTFK